MRNSLMQNFAGDGSKEKLDIYTLFDGKMKTKIVENSESRSKVIHSWLLKINLENSHIFVEFTGYHSESLATLPKLSMQERRHCPSTR